MRRRNRYVLIIAGFAAGLTTVSLAQEPTTGTQSITIVGSPPPKGEPTVPPFTTLYRFTGAQGIYDPRGGLAMDGSGNLYGTTYYGGNCTTCGTIYKLTAPNWSYTELHSGILDKTGIGPTAPLTISGSTIFGTMSVGGNPRCGCGTIFSISTNGSGYQDIYFFGPGAPQKPVDGSTPIGGVILVGGMLYGTTSAGGKYGNGVIYKVSPSGSGYTVLYNFNTPNSPQNSGSQGELLLGKDGNLYGTQYGGGKYNQGMFFRIGTNGANFEDLHDFMNVFTKNGVNDGANPQGRLAQASNGTIYGTTELGGTPNGYGTAWSWSASKGYQQIYRFVAEQFNSANTPHSGLVIDTNGALYGTGGGGGIYGQGCGAAFKLTPGANGTFTYNTMYSFQCHNPNGNIPYNVLLNDHLVYGTNVQGGTLSGACAVHEGCGTVFEINPANSP